MSFPGSYSCVCHAMYSGDNCDQPTPEPGPCVNNQPEECGSADGVNTFCDIGGYADLGPCAAWNGFVCDDLTVMESFGYTDAAGASAALIAACPLTCDTC